MELAKHIRERSQTLQALAGIVTFTDKIIDDEFRDKIKEEICMTQIGQMIFEDGVRQGVEEGVKQERQRINRLNQLLAGCNRQKIL